MIRKRACLYVPGGLIGQLLYQWEGVIQLSHVGRAPRGMTMTGVFISAKPSNLLHIAEPLPTLFTNTPRNRASDRGCECRYDVLSAGNQLSGDRFQHVFESGDPRQTEIEDAKKSTAHLSLAQRSQCLYSLSNGIYRFTNIFF